MAFSGRRGRSSPTMTPIANIIISPLGNVKQRARSRRVNSANRRKNEPFQEAAVSAISSITTTTTIISDAASLLNQNLSLCVEEKSMTEISTIIALAAAAAL